MDFFKPRSQIVENNIIPQVHHPHQEGAPLIKCEYKQIRVVRMRISMDAGKRALLVSGMLYE